MFTIQVKDKRTETLRGGSGADHGKIHRVRVWAGGSGQYYRAVKNHTSAEVSVFHDGELIHSCL